MSRKIGTRLVLSGVTLCLTSLGAWCALRSLAGPVPEGARGGPGAGDRGVSAAKAGPAPADPLEQQFAARVRPFLERYCFSCHGPKKQRAKLDLSRDATVTAV